MKKQTFARLAELCGQAYAGTITPEDMADGIQKAARLELNFDPAKFGKHLRKLSAMEAVGVPLGHHRCIGGGSDPATAPAPAPATQEPPAATPAPQVTTQPRETSDQPDGCSPVSDDMARSVLDGTSGGELQPVRAAAVRGGGGDWFIAVRFRHDAGEDTGVWQSRSLEPGQAAIGSVDAFAKRYTHWPDTGNAGSQAERDAKACLR